MSQGHNCSVLRGVSFWIGNPRMASDKGVERTKLPTVLAGHYAAGSLVPELPQGEMCKPCVGSPSWPYHVHLQGEVDIITAAPIRRILVFVYLSKEKNLFSTQASKGPCSKTST